jgi:hypothetical protein
VRWVCDSSWRFSKKTARDAAPRTAKATGECITRPFNVNSREPAGRAEARHSAAR